MLHDSKFKASHEAEQRRVHEILHDDAQRAVDDAFGGVVKRDPATWGLLKGQRRAPSGRRSALAGGWLSDAQIAAANRICLGYEVVARDVAIRAPAWWRVDGGRGDGDWTEFQIDARQRYLDFIDALTKERIPGGIIMDFAVDDMTPNKIARRWRSKAARVKKLIAAALDIYADL